MKELLYIDLFCGAGGTSTGVERATYNGNKCARVIACVNHDANAIASHAANHPNAIHYTEDIRTLDLTELSAHTAKERRQNPNALVVLWASLECTNFSNAKGGQPRDADSRTLAEHLFRYIETLNPDYIQIENVREFMYWGDLDEQGHPVSRDKGRLYLKWINKVCKYGYDFNHRILNSANYGAYTSRERFFGIFAKKGLPIVFPEPTHCKNGLNDIFGHLEKWKPVREVLDLEDCGRSIFGRNKNLSEATLSRIYAGLLKFCKTEQNTFLVKYNSMNKDGHYTAPSIDEPCPTVACQNRLGIATAHFLSKQFSSDPSSLASSIDAPAGTITCIDHHALITYHGNDKKPRSIDQPAPTITTHDDCALVSVNQFLDNQYGNGKPTGINIPCGTIVGNPKQQLVTVKGDGKFLFNPQFGSQGSPLDKPCFTLIARMDKRPPSIVTTRHGDPIALLDEDTPMTRKIKEFMIAHAITDIYMRMLNVNELKRIMGFGDTYTLIGTQAEQKKYIGNAVEVHMASALCQALYQKINQ